MRGLVAIAGEDLQKNRAVRRCCTCPPLPEDHGPRWVGLCAWSTAEGNAQASCTDGLSLTLSKSGAGRLRRSSEHRQASAGDSDARLRVEGDVQPRPPVIWREASQRVCREGDNETVAGVGQVAPWRVSAPPGRDEKSTRFFFPDLQRLPAVSLIRARSECFLWAGHGLCLSKLDLLVTHLGRGWSTRRP